MHTGEFVPVASETTFFSKQNFERLESNERADSHSVMPTI